MNQFDIDKEKLEKMFKGLGSSPQVFNKSSASSIYIKDIAIIQSFYGTNLERISATTSALKQILNSTVKPEEHIFIEAQRSSKECIFKWLKNFGVNYIFIKITDKQDGIFLKTPLWNIGFCNSKMNKLCFIDSDVFFINSDWLIDVSNKFDQGFDVLSLHGYSYYENNSSVQRIAESIGHAVENNSSGKHYGFTIGIKRNILNKIGGFSATYILDDLEYWRSIIGDSFLKNIIKDNSFSNQERFGIDVVVGSTEHVLCHCDHGEDPNRNPKYKDLIDIAHGKINSFKDVISYNVETPEILPEWKTDTKIGRVIKRSVLEYYDSKLDGMRIRDLYFKNAKLEFSKLDQSKNLIIATSFKRSFNKNFYKLNDFIKKLDDKNIKFRGLVCFSDMESNDILDKRIKVVPIDDKYVQELGMLQIFRNDVELNDGVNVLYIKFDHDVQYQEFLECEPGDICISKSEDIYFKYCKDTINLIRRMCVFGTDFVSILKYNGIQFNNIEKYIR